MRPNEESCKKNINRNVLKFILNKFISEHETYFKRYLVFKEF